MLCGFQKRGWTLIKRTIPGGLYAQLADRETCSAVHRKLIQMGLVEQICDEPQTWRNTPLGKELDLDLLLVFIGHWDECEIPIILEEYGLIDEGPSSTQSWNARPRPVQERLLSGYAKRAYFDYRKAAKFLH